ncbi:MAG: hypothetical protein ABL934_18400 [Lysobacteraceae bacterium]
MLPLARWLAPAALAAALGAGALFPAAARADDDLVRVIVDVADIVYRSGQPYYRYGDYGYNDRLIVERDYRGRPVYYRTLPRGDDRYRTPYGNAYGYRRNHGNYNNDYSRNGFVRDPYGRYSRQRCDSRGRCRVEYYDPRYDRDDGDYDRYNRHDRDHRRRHDDD